MNISSNMPNINANQNANTVKTDFSEKISKEEAKELRSQITAQANSMMLKSVSIQSNIGENKDAYADFQDFLKGIGYEGKPIADLSQSEAAELISEDGIFGITQTSERIANFVINGSNGDEDRMRAGREGMLQGFKDAEAMWGGKLPEISQKTMQAAVEMVDKAMHEAGFSILDKEI